MSNSNSARSIKALALVSFLSLTGASTWAFDPPDAAYNAYQCAVAGQSWACGGRERQSTSRTEEHLIPGPLAAYAIHTGVPKDQAIAQARMAGEVPTRQLLRITNAVLTPAEKWARLNDVTAGALQTVEVLSNEPDRSPAALACGDSSQAI